MRWIVAWIAFMVVAMAIQFSSKVPEGFLGQAFHAALLIAVGVSAFFAGMQTAESSATGKDDGR